MFSDVFSFLSIVFGVELEFLLRRETGSEHVPWGTVPTIIEQCLSEVESRGLSEVGICTCGSFIYCLLAIINRTLILFLSFFF